MKFIILTRIGGGKVVINADHIQSIEPNPDGSFLYFSGLDWRERVVESIDEIAAMLEIKLPESKP